MATKTASKAGPATREIDDQDPVAVLMAWYRKNKRMVTIVVAALAVVLAGGWFWLAAKSRREDFGARALQNARASFAAGNLPLAENDLARVVSTYGGTNAGSEAAILLGQVRLLLDEDALAVTGLRDFIASGPKQFFREPAQSLLAAALEEVGQMEAASEAYRRAAEIAEHSFRKAELLNNAARTLALAGDVPGAIEIYRRVFNEFPDAPGEVEARVRAAELGYVAQT